ncbi:MAG: protein-L-isoaspartate O-methyltransferase [Alphaproteobacteria bacterium]
MTSFSQTRKNMVDSQIHTAGVINPSILDAFRNVPRETFVPKALRNIAYGDGDLPIGGGRYLSEPIVHGRMIQAANPEKTDRVLDIGGGTGYAAAIMASIAGYVTVLEEDRQFLDYAVQAWAHLGFQNVVPAIGPLAAGYAQGGPYDIIFIHGAVTEIPLNIAAQLAPGGRMLTIVKQPGTVMGKATMTVAAGNTYSSRTLFDAGADYLPAFAPQQVFVFNG